MSRDTEAFGGLEAAAGVALSAFEKRVRLQCKECGDCLLWTGLLKGGRPGISHKGRTVSVRRALLEESGAKLRPGNIVVGNCEHPLCVAHWKQCTVTEFRRMQAAQGHGKRPSAKRLTARRARSILTWEIVHAMRASDEADKVLAARYGCCKETVKRVRSFETWREEIVSPFAGLMR